MTDSINEKYLRIAREQMIHEQLVLRGIHDKSVLSAFYEIPRHIFMPENKMYEAYSDYPSYIGYGQTISQPFIVALMLEYLDVNDSSRVLEIGTGSGYSTALICLLASEVISLDVFEGLITDARFRLETLGLNNFKLYHQSGWEGIPGQHTFDRIILWASPPKLPDNLLKQLSDDGIMVAPIGKMDQHVWVFQKKGGKIHKSKRDAVRFVPLIRVDSSELK